MQRTIIVGDVHGCADELDDVLAACAWTAADRVVLAGDLVAKGPDSAGVLARARALGALAVLGNHDAHSLHVRKILAGEIPHDKHEPKPEHVQVVATLKAEDWAYLEALPLWLRLGAERPGEADTVVVHAGCVPGVPVEQQERENLITMRSLREDGSATKKLKGRPWAAAWSGPERIVFGHDALRGLQQHPMATGLDTGCVYGGKLTALILPERRLVQIPARRPYVPM